MKKIFIALTLCMALVLSFVGCGKTADTENKSGNISSSEMAQANDNGEITLDDVLNHETSPEEDFEYSSEEENSSSVGLASYKGNKEIAVVPETLDGRPVTKVDKWAINTNSINDMSNLRGIRFSDSITEFEALACQAHKQLEIVVLGKGTKTLGEGTFFECDALKEVVLNDGLETIGSSAFAWCYNLKSITIPESVTTIEFGAFEYDITIYGKSGSAAEEFAKSNEINFVAQ